MRYLKKLFDNNRRWAGSMTRTDPGFFQKLSHQQTPEYLWIGCSDSRVPANEIIGLMPGEVFVHRNVANIVAPADINCLSVLQYAVDVLRVKHVIVCGHYGCGGVAAVIKGGTTGLIDSWLQPIKDIRDKHAPDLSARRGSARTNRLCELNVIEQARSVCHTSIIQNAWRRGQKVAVHGWVYKLTDGLLHDLGFTAAGPEEIMSTYRRTLRRTHPLI